MDDLTPPHWGAHERPAMTPTTEEAAALAEAHKWMNDLPCDQLEPLLVIIRAQRARDEEDFLERLTTERDTLLAGQARAVAEAVSVERERCAKLAEAGTEWDWSGRCPEGLFNC